MKSGTTCLPSTLDAPAQNALAEWNRFAGAWRVLNGRVDTANISDAYNSIVFLSRAEANRRHRSNLGANVLAVAFSRGGLTGSYPTSQTCSRLVEADIIMLTDHQWSSNQSSTHYARRAGNTAVYDFRQVMAHDAGHALGLLHKGRWPAVMNDTYLDHLGADFTGHDASIARTSRTGATPRTSRRGDDGLWLFERLPADVGGGPRVPGRHR
ncbi:MAG: matrixin family metalloprotease [Myxococcota bacterium]